MWRYKMSEEKNIMAKYRVDDLIKVLKISALANQKETEKKLREIIPQLDFGTFIIMGTICAEVAAKYTPNIKGFKK